MKHKLFYTQPTTDLLELRSEGLICESILIYFGDPGDAGTIEPEEPGHSYTF